MFWQLFLQLRPFWRRDPAAVAGSLVSRGWWWCHSRNMTSTCSQRAGQLDLSSHSLLDVTTLSSATTCPVLHWDAGTRRNRWCAGLAKIATRRRGLQVLFDDRFDKIGHFTESEVNEGTKGTFWRFESSSYRAWAWVRTGSRYS